MENAVNGILTFSLFAHIVMIAICTWRFWVSEGIFNRLVISELVATLVLSVLVLVTIISQEQIYIDVALALAALGFVGYIALSKYVADQQMF